MQDLLILGGTILTLAASIGLGICMSYWFMIKLMKRPRFQEMLRSSVSDLVDMTVDMSIDAADKAAKKMEERFKKSDKEDED